MGRQDVDSILDDLRIRFANIGGVTLTEDVSGEWGPLGARRFTPRPHINNVGITLLVESVRDA